MNYNWLWAVCQPRSLRFRCRNVVHLKMFFMLAISLCRDYLIANPPHLLSEQSPTGPSNLNSVHPETRINVGEFHLINVGEFHLMSHWQFSIRKGGIFRPGAYSLTPRHFRIAQRRTERCKERACPEPAEGRGCAEAYLCTPHKKPRRLTQQGRKRTLSGRKLNNAST